MKDNKMEVVTQSFTGSYNSSVSGPQLVLSKTHLFMDNFVDKTECGDLVVENTGTAAVFYEWRKYPRADFIKAKRSDGVARFFCHHVRDI